MLVNDDGSFRRQKSKEKFYSMKKFMTMMLGLSLVIGSAAFAFGDDPKPATDTTKKAKKNKKKKTTTTTTPPATTPPAK
jgi:hypothetical protein